MAKAEDTSEHQSRPKGRGNNAYSNKSYELIKLEKEILFVFSIRIKNKYRN